MKAQQPGEKPDRFWISKKPDFFPLQPSNVEDFVKGFFSSKNGVNQPPEIDIPYHSRSSKKNTSHQKKWC